MSNLHKCPEGCTLKHDDQVFLSSEHMYQHCKLKAHNIPEVDSILDEEDPFKVMQKVIELLPNKKVSIEWNGI